MKILILLFLAGFAAASEYDALEEAAESLVLQDDYFYVNKAADEVERAARGSSFKEMDELLDRIKEGIETQDKYKNRDGNNEEDDEVTAFFRDLLGKIGKTKKSIQSWEIDASRADFDLKALFQKLKKSLLEKIDKDKMKAKIEEIFGKGNEMADALLNLINEKGDKWKNKLQDLIDRYLGKDDKRSLTESAEDDVTSELGKKLREQLDEILEKIKEGIEKGKGIREEYIDKMKDIREKLREMKEDIGTKAKELLQKLKDKAKDYWRELLDKLGGRNDRSIQDWEIDAARAEDDTKTELGKKLREQLDEILEKIKEGIEKGKGIREEYIDKMKDIREKLKEMKEDIGTKAKELLQKLKDKAKDYWRELLDKLGGRNDRSIQDWEIDAARAEDDTKTELGKKLREQLDEILEKIKEGIEKGKGIREEYIDKMKDIREKLKEMKEDIGTKAKELLQKLKDKAKDYWRELLDKLGGRNDRSIQDWEIDAARAEDDTKTELGKKLREQLDEILEKIKEGIEKGKGVREEYIDKMKDIREKLREMKEDIGTKAKELLQKLKEKAKDFWRDLLDKLGGRNDRSIQDWETDFSYRADDDDVKTELGKKLREQLDEILEKIKEGIEKGKGVREEYIDKMKDIREKLREMKEDIGTKAKELLQKLKDKAKDFWRDLLDKLGGRNDRSIQGWEIDAAHADFDLKAIFEKLKKTILDKVDKDKVKAKIEELFGKGNEMADALLNLINEKGDKWKNKLQDLIDRYLGKE